VSTCEFTERAFDGVALAHPLLESFGTLFLAALLQKFMVCSPTMRERCFYPAGMHFSRSGQLWQQRCRHWETVEDLDARLLADP
jgi:hypothetical protein